MGKIIDIVDNGKKKKIAVLKYLKLKNTSDKYILYTDVSNQNNKIIYASLALEKGNDLYLMEVADKNAKKQLTDMIQLLMNK